LASAEDGALAHKPRDLIGAQSLAQGALERFACATLRGFMKEPAVAIPSVDIAGQARSRSKVASMRRHDGKAYERRGPLIRLIASFREIQAFASGKGGFANIAHCEEVGRLTYPDERFQRREMPAAANGGYRLGEPLRELSVPGGKLEFGQVELRDRRSQFIVS
jgi:hypothetical protein